MTISGHWRFIYGGVFVVMAGILAGILGVVPRDETGMQWTSPMFDGGWMAWTFPVALFFYCILTLLVIFSLLAIRYPEAPRRGVLGMRTTRGDRLFISLLGSGFINMGWLYFFGAPLTGSLLVCAIYTLAVFRWV